MIDRQHGKLVFECDCCAETFEGESSELAEVWSAAKRDGWKSKKIGEEWVHACGKCKL